MAAHLDMADVDATELVHRLRRTDHVQLILSAAPSPRHCLLFAPGNFLKFFYDVFGVSGVMDVLAAVQVS